MANGNLPDVVLLVLCESAAFDDANRVWVLVRPFAKIALPAGESFPNVLDRAALYYQLTDAFGTFDIWVEVVSPGGLGLGPTTLRTTTHSVSFPQDRTVIDDVFYLSGIPLLEDGEYEIRLVANNVPLRRSLFIKISTSGAP